MKGFGLERCALSGGVALALLAGCGASQPPIGAPNAMQQTVATDPTRFSVNRVQPSSPFRVLHRFSGGSDGAIPYAGLIDVRGTLYGTTNVGGGSYYCRHGCGTVYSISTTGAEKVLHRFTGPDGTNPRGLIDVNGMLYGTAGGGGASGNGTVYKISTTGNLRVLYSFGGGSDGSGPLGLIDVKGTLYGTTVNGGPCNCGTVFSISRTGSEHVLHSFTGPDGMNPLGTLINVRNTLYGTTQYGGAKCEGEGYVGCGTVYKISTTGNLHVLYNFGGGTDGYAPQASLIDVKGTLYGTTAAGGNSGCNHVGCGTVYGISTSGTEKVLHRFGSGSDGTQPLAGLIDMKGMLYGTTWTGGEGCGGVGCGTVYRISTTGSEKVLHMFSGDSGGAAPSSNLISVKGVLYGTTEEGGSSCHQYAYCGIVFSFAP